MQQEQAAEKAFNIVLLLEFSVWKSFEYKLYIILDNSINLK